MTMKKTLLLLSVFGVLSLTPVVLAQDEVSGQETAQTEVVTEQVAAPVTSAPVESNVIEENGEKYKVNESIHAQIKTKFIEGDPIFMAPVLLTLILGLALAIERIVYLNMATTNTKKLLSEVEEALKKGGVDSAKEVCRNTAGPVASIFYQGLDRSSEGIDVVEKSVVAYGGVQMGLLEKNLSWISLFIALAPMLGFLGTVIGMIGAFDAIEAAGDISANIVAGGIKVALLTTVAGLVVAIILQIFYNAIMAKIDEMVNTMEDASISLVDLVVKYAKK